MDILIKSFNRPFYLDRCLASIQTFVDGTYSIKVLDDGTPEKYLNKIKVKYPTIKIVKSENYLEKEEAIKQNLKTGKEIDGFKIPTQLWVTAVKEASPYFIITEDDVWFTKEIHVSELIKIMKEEDISLLRLGWLGNDNFIKQFKHVEITPYITANYPDLFTASPFIMRCFFYNKLKFFSLLYKLGLVTNHTKAKYWILNSILMGIYKKEYWLKIWDNIDGKVDEKRQLYNSTMYYRKYKHNKKMIAQLNDEVMKTTFTSSATNSYHNYGFDFDVNQYNFLMNEKWFSGEFDSLQNFPKDFSEDYIASFLKNKDNRKIKLQEWKKWSEKFKNQYRIQGCSVDE
ncbi:hypothetical protein Ga0061079_102165 [Apibacter mensalis]|uniref:Glycosyl transferase family 2 n=1 Tax=Apibacter mensalis TaxID=1586267 RepID=A0A0X3ANJ0_9FLAO|nr:glycosyltransferase family 2 protein [Apibacter mensalis]CVK15615.1 hypothetical protein Ga0061079_102165 [Apibacter mensalis]